MIVRSLRTWVAVAFISLVLGGVPAAAAPGDAAQSSPTSLYDRLGGLAPISVVVSDFIDLLVSDAVLNANPAIDAARKKVPAPYLKYHVTALVCQATGGPCEYKGREMNTAHAHLNITEREWDRMVTVFKEVLAKHKVPAKETQELVDIVGSTKAEIVAARADK
jgi:hemoglobin